MHAAIMCAAVADYTPVTPSGKKIKRSDDILVLKLKPNKDIAASLGSMKKKGQVLAGFALETDHGIVNARKKLAKKNLDFIVLNSLTDAGAGFKHDTNKITILDRSNKPQHFPLLSKKDAASGIVNKLISVLK